MFYAASNLFSITHMGGNNFKIHSLILGHEYLMMSKGSAALMKPWVNTCSVSTNSSSKLILHCLKHNVGFKLMVSISVLPLFQCPTKNYPVNTHTAADILFLPRFVETQLNNNQGPALLNISNQLKVSEVITCMNTGAAVSKGGT